MPELPEVQTIISDLVKKILHKKIIKVEVRLKKITKNNIKVLVGKSFVDILRRGKYIFIKINNGKYLAIHLRMTGQLIYQKNKEIVAGGHSEQKNDFDLPAKHTHVSISFSDKSKLYYNDQRQFGYLEIIDQKKFDEYSERIGIEPLSKEFNLEYLKEILKNKKRNVKAFLLDQKYIAGIGNIYADEVLFSAGVRPDRNTSTLKKREIEKILSAIKIILKKAIDNRGTTFNNYVDADGNKGKFIKLLKVYNREGQQCVKCKNIIIKTKIASRGTRYCNKCQK